MNWYKVCAKKLKWFLFIFNFSIDCYQVEVEALNNNFGSTAANATNAAISDTGDL